MSDMIESTDKKVAGKPTKSAWREWIESMLVIGVFAVVIRSFVIAPFVIPSSSMVPTLLVGDYLFVSRFNYGLRIPFTDIQLLASKAARGDVVVFDYPEDRSKDYIKRVVGVPGDTIAYQDNVLYVNGQKMPLKADGMYTYFMGDNSSDVSGKYTEKLFDVEHSVLRKSYSIKDGQWEVPEGYYFMMGDNRNNSRDSRFWGFVPQSYLVGKAVVIWWSWDSAAGSIRWDRLGTLLH